MSSIRYKEPGAVKTSFMQRLRNDRGKVTAPRDPAAFHAASSGVPISRTQPVAAPTRTSKPMVQTTAGPLVRQTLEDQILRQHADEWNRFRMNWAKQSARENSQSDLAAGRRMVARVARDIGPAAMAQINNDVLSLNHPAVTKALCRLALLHGYGDSAPRGGMSAARKLYRPQARTAGGYVAAARMMIGDTLIGIGLWLTLGAAHRALARQAAAPTDDAELAVA